MTVPVELAAVAMHQSRATSKPPEAGEIAKGMVELLAASTPSLDSSTWPYSRSVDDELVCMWSKRCSTRTNCITAGRLWRRLASGWSTRPIEADLRG